MKARCKEASSRFTTFSPKHGKGKAKDAKSKSKGKGKAKDQGKGKAKGSVKGKGKAKDQSQVRGCSVEDLETLPRSNNAKVMIQT